MLFIIFYYFLSFITVKSFSYVCCFSSQTKKREKMLFFFQKKTFPSSQYIKQASMNYCPEFQHQQKPFWNFLIERGFWGICHVFFLCTHNTFPPLRKQNMHWVWKMFLLSRQKMMPMQMNLMNILWSFFTA